MTLEQSEYQRLVEQIIELSERHRGDPNAREAILSELRNLYKKIPIYPGIITTLLPKVVQSIEMDRLKEGEEVVLVLRDGHMISGKVAEISLGEIKLVEGKRLDISNLVEKVSVRREDVRETKVISRVVLEKEWPSLDFEEK
jgi:hypothetical protein